MEKRRLFVHTEANLCETEAKHEFLLHIEATNPVSVAPLPPVHLISLRGLRRTRSTAHRFEYFVIPY